MRKQLHIMMNEDAFYLPYVLIVSLITLSLITTSIMVYQQELSMTDNLIEHVEIETLIQMARAKFIEDYVNNEEMNGQVNYEFPSGTVNLLYKYVADEVIELHFKVVTNKQSNFEIIHELAVSG